MIVWFLHQNKKTIRKKLNNMIDKIYIESAKRIREDYVALMKPLDFYLAQLKDMSDMFVVAIADLEKFNSELHTKTKEKAESELYEKLQKVEEDQNKIQKVIEPLNKKIEDLRKEESALWNQIKMSYPDITEEQLINEIQKSL